MIRQGVLTPADSATFIARFSKHVQICEKGLDLLCKEMLLSMSDKLQIPDTGANIIYLPKDHPKALDWIFVADALNFCFWSNAGAEKWTVEGHSGYYALEAALARAMKENYDITDPNFYSNITKDQLHTIMRSDNQAQIPLFNERLSVLNEVGTILIEKYNGTFKTCLKEANKSAMKLLEIVVNNFPCFRDEAIYENKNVSFYKRAQILVADIWNFFGGKGLGEFDDIDRITMFADYRVPQVLVYYGALKYSEELMNILKNDELLPSGSEKEIEIRGCSIHAVELLKEKIEAAVKGSTVEVPNSCLIDYYLWCYRRKHADKLESIPFHKTLGIFY